MIKKIALVVLIIIVFTTPLWLEIIYPSIREIESIVPPVAVIDFAGANKKLEPDVEFNVKSIQVVDGSIFRILLENDLWIEGRLTRATKENATEEVVDFLKQAKRLSVRLRRKMDGYWIVNLNVTRDLDEKENTSDLADFLIVRGLIF